MIDFPSPASAQDAANGEKIIGEIANAFPSDLTDELRINEVMLQLQHMMQFARDQLTRIFQNYEPRDIAEALDVWRKDQKTDALDTSLFRELLNYMTEKPSNITFGTHMLFCAKNIERIGDHATNLAETVYYIVEGRQLPEERPKADVTSKEVLPQSARRQRPAILRREQTL